MTIIVIDHESFAPRPSSLDELASKRYTQQMEALQQLAVEHARRYMGVLPPQEGMTESLKSRIMEHQPAK